MSGRPKFSGISTVYHTITRTFSVLLHHKLGVLIPVFGVLLLLAALLWVINTIAPLAPFVYSLF